MNKSLIYHSSIILANNNLIIIKILSLAETLSIVWYLLNSTHAKQ